MEDRTIDELIDELIPMKVKILYALRKNGGMVRHRDIVATVRMSSTAFYTNMRELMYAGYVEKRDIYYVLTQKGLEYIEKLKDFYKKFADML